MPRNVDIEVSLWLRDIYDELVELELDDTPKDLWLNAAIARASIGLMLCELNESVALEPAERGDTEVEYESERAAFYGVLSEYARRNAAEWKHFMGKETG